LILSHLLTAYDQIFCLVGTGKKALGKRRREPSAKISKSANNLINRDSSPLPAITKVSTKSPDHLVSSEVFETNTSEDKQIVTPVKKKKSRTTFTAYQLEELERAFEKAPYPGN